MAKIPSRPASGAKAPEPSSPAPSIPAPLDLGVSRSVEAPPADRAAPPPWLELRPHDIEKQREDVRARVTFFLLWTLAGLVVAILASLWVAWIAGSDAADLEESVKTIAGLVLNPLIALLGTVIGFYFGAQRSREGENSSPDPSPSPPGKGRPVARRSRGR